MSDEKSDDEDEEEDSEGDDFDDEGDGSDDEDASKRKAEDEEEEVGGWGSSKKDYYNADTLETEADAMEEEEEARRLQQKRLKEMSEADFGFDEDEWADGKDKEEEDDQGGVITEVLPQLEITDDMSVEERLKILKSRYPEFEPLAKDFVDLQTVHADLKLAAEAAIAATQFAKSSKSKKLNAETSSKTPVAAIKLRALSAYLGVTSMYFALLSSTSKDSSGNPVALSAQKLRDHPVMQSLVASKRMWESVRDISVPDVAELIEDEASASEHEIAIDVTTTPQKSASKPKKTKAQRVAEEAVAAAAAARAAKLAQTEANIASLSSLPSLKSKSTKSSTNKALKPATTQATNTDFGDEDPLSSALASEKAQRKKSLRFYTSEIAQKANRRGEAGRLAGGDMDLPRRERNKDRIERLNALAAKKGRNGADLDDNDDDSGDERPNRERRGGDDDDEYYDMVTALSSKKKASKRAAADAQNAPAPRITDNMEVGPDGKRAINYQIQKNKGLTPHRSKDVRNPRVKKKKKYEEKMKKLGSMKAVYKGGEGRGGYGGEMTGIKKNVVKSVKLG